MPSARARARRPAPRRRSSWQDTLLNRRIAWPKGTVSYECTFLPAALSPFLPRCSFPARKRERRPYLSALLQDTSVSAAMLVACNHARNSKAGEREIAD